MAPFGQGDNSYISEEPGYEGQIATTRSSIVRTTLNQTDALPFGRVVVRGASPEESVLPSAAGQDVIGIIGASLEFEQHLDANGDSSYEAMRPAKLVEDADIWVVPETAVDTSVDDRVYFRHTASGTPGAFDRIGRLRADNDGGNAELLPGARFIRNASAAGVPVMVNFTPPSRA